MGLYLWHQPYKGEKNENDAIVAKPTRSCNAIFNYTYRYEIKKKPQIFLYIAIGVANSAAKTTILVLTSFDMRVFLSPLRRAEIATPSKRGWQESLTGAL
jgi:hypothetical protein